MLHLLTPPEVCHALNNSVRRCSYLVSILHVINYSILKRIFPISCAHVFIASPALRRGLRVLCELLYSQHYVWSPYTTHDLAQWILQALSSFTCSRASSRRFPHALNTSSICVSCRSHVLFLTLPLRACSDTCFLSPPPRGGLDLVTNRQGAI